MNEEGQPGVDPGNAVWNRKVLGVRVRGWAGARAGLFADMHVREEMKEPKDTPCAVGLTCVSPSSDRN